MWSRPGTPRGVRRSPTPPAGSPDRQSRSAGRPRASSGRAARAGAGRRPDRRRRRRRRAVARQRGQHDARMEHIRAGQLHRAPHSGDDSDMHAVEVAETGGPEVLRYVEKPMPSPGPGEVLIQADAIGVNYIDTYFRSGLYPRRAAVRRRQEVCGTVAAVGDDVAAINIGDRVVTANAAGAYAEYCIAPADFVAYVPDVGAVRRHRLRAAERHDCALPDQVGLPGAAARLAAGARRSGRRRADPHPVGDQPRRAGHHHGLHRRRRPNCPGRPVPSRCSTIPRTPPSSPTGCAS